MSLSLRTQGFPLFIRAPFHSQCLLAPMNLVSRACAPALRAEALSKVAEVDAIQPDDEALGRSARTHGFQDLHGANGRSTTVAVKQPLVPEQPAGIQCSKSIDRCPSSS